MSADSLATDDEVLGKAYDARLIARLWGYVRPYGTLVAASLGLVVALSAVQLTQPYLVKRAIDKTILGQSPEGLALPAALYLATILAEFGLSYLQLYTLERTGQSVVFDIRNRLFGHVQRLPSTYFDRTPVGRLMTRVTTDVESLNEAFTSGLVLILADLVKLSGIVVILLVMDWRLALVTFAIVPPMLVLSWHFRLRVRHAYRLVRSAVARLNAFLQENVSGMRIVQLFRRERTNAEEFAELNRLHREAQIVGVRYESLFSAAVELIASLSLAAIIWAGGSRWLSGAVTFGTLVAFIEYAGRFFRPVQELSQRYAVMQSAMASAERIFELMDTPAEAPARGGSRRPPERPRGEIVFEEVTFAYEPGVPVLRGVSFRIRPGERVGVVGWTGAGKSTLVRLLTRLYQVEDGRILLDGVDVRDYDLGDLRRTIGVVPQEGFLFSGTIEANLSLDDPRVTPERVREAARIVGADRFIEKLPGGYAATLRERGSNLSVGERQMLAFARAVAFDPAILVLDEATSSVDPETEHRIRQALERVLAGRTSIVIAHRLATLRSADRILVMHHGRLREQGTHDQLLRLEDGVYRSLYALQTLPG